MFRFKGKHSTYHNQQIFIHQQSQQLYHQQAEEQQLPNPQVTPSYIHLGTKLDYKLSIDNELQTRIAQAKEAIRPYQHTIFKNPNIPIATKTQIIQSLSLSRLLYNTETWPTLNKSQSKRFHAAVIKIYRTALLATYNSTDHLPDHLILQQTQLPHPTDLLRQRRLNYATRAYQHAPDILFAVLHHQAQQYNNSWLQQLQQDLLWAQLHVPKTYTYLQQHPNFHNDSATPLQQLKEQPNTFKTRIKYAVKLSQQHTSLTLEAQHNLALIKQQAQLAGIKTIDDNSKNATATIHTCNSCSQSFNTFTGLCSHQFHKHQRVKIA
jgi:hypothetical protein